MGRPTGWDVVGLPRDPTPGDVYGISALKSSYAALANEAASAATVLRTIKSSASESGVWQGAAAQAFAEQIGDFPEMLDKCEKSYRDVVSALGSWRSVVDAQQDQADKHLTKAKAAQQDIDAGGSKVSSAQLTFTSAEASLNAALKKISDWQGQTPPANIKLPTPADISHLRSSKASARSALVAVQGDVADAKSRLETARKLIGEAKAAYESAAESTATVIREARKKAVPKDSIWKKIADSKAWQILVAVVTVVIAVAVVIALVVGTGGAVLALIIAAAGLILTLDDIVQFMSGNMSGAEFALAVALSLIPGGKAGKAIVSGLKRAVGPLVKVAGALGDLRKVTGPAMAKLAAGFKDAGAKIADRFALARKEWAANPDAGYIRFGPRDLVVEHMDKMVAKFDQLAKDPNLPPWKRKMFEGTRFNWENYGRYKYREVSVTVDGKTYRLDSYVHGKEVVSRKYTQFADIQESTGVSYLREMTSKYNPNVEPRITSAVPSQTGVPDIAGLKGKKLDGVMILEVPVQKGPVPEAILKAARDADPPIMIRDIRGKVYR